MIYVDLDDFHEENNRLLLLEHLKREVPNFKATLFTIPARCSLQFVVHIREKYPWLDMVPHGWLHSSNYECADWSVNTARSYLNIISHLGLTHGFKAPGWQISDGIYTALLESGYWVADQTYNNSRRPQGLRAYLLDSWRKIHGHIGHMNGHNLNELDLLVPNILQLPQDTEFGFIKDLF